MTVKIDLGDLYNTDSVVIKARLLRSKELCRLFIALHRLHKKTGKASFCSGNLSKIIKVNYSLIGRRLDELDRLNLLLKTESRQNTSIIYTPTPLFFEKEFVKIAETIVGVKV